LLKSFGKIEEARTSEGLGDPQGPAELLAIKTLRCRPSGFRRGGKSTKEGPSGKAEPEVVGLRDVESQERKGLRFCVKTSWRVRLFKGSKALKSSVVRRRRGMADNENGKRATVLREMRLFEGSKTLKGKPQERLDLKEGSEVREEKTAKRVTKPWKWNKRDRQSPE
jgi:hypothetical protein